MEGKVSVDIKDTVATVSFFHPQSNSLPGELLRTLANAIEETGKKEEVSVIILKSEGEKAFCGGASVDELVAELA